MESTTSNEKRGVCTRGTDHVAIATSPDMCFVPGEPSPRPFENTVETSELKTGATTRTFIAGDPVWTAAGELGPLSDPAHEGTDGGVTSGTYRGQARPTSYSRDVFAEGLACVRCDDTTTQNAGNTVGVVTHAAPPAQQARRQQASTGDCGFLNNDAFTVQSNEANFSRHRGEGEVLPGEKERDFTYPDRLGVTPSDVKAKSQTVQVGTKKIEVVTPPGTPSGGLKLPTADQVANSLAGLPPGLLDSVQTVVLYPVPDPRDTGTNRTVGSASNGRVNIHPSDGWKQEELDATMIHEATHLYKSGLWRREDNAEATWSDAVTWDQRHPSEYAKESMSEDFSESVVMYYLSKGTPCEARAKELYPGRYRVLEGIFGDNLDSPTKEPASP